MESSIENENKDKQKEEVKTEADLIMEYYSNSNFSQLSDFEKNIKNYLPLEILDICKALFNKISKNSEFVDSAQLINMLRLLDLNPSKSEVTKMLKMLTVSSNPNEIKSTINFYEFVICVAKKRRESNTFQELLSAFKILDRDGTGKIAEPVLRFNLCRKGGEEVFSNEEMDAFMKEAAQFIETIDDVNYLKYHDYGLFLKDLYNPPVVDKPKKKGK